MVTTYALLDEVYAAFSYSDHTQQIQNLPEEILLSCFVTTLNDTFETELAQEDDGSESESENFNTPTPISQQSSENLSHLHGGGFILQSGKLWSITSNSRAA